MKSVIFFISTFLLTQLSQAQLFTKITAGSIVNTRSDSRSVNFVDVDNDGWEDIFISNGLSTGQNNMLYINKKDGTFRTVTGGPIVRDNSRAVGASFADVDNDGDLDGYIVTWYGDENLYYQNDGNGTFSHLRNVAIKALGSKSETAAWGDFDNDGKVDLYVTNSGAQKNLLFWNQGNSNFSKESNGSWVNTINESRSVNFADYDGDGLMDIFVSNESSQKNELYKNMGSRTFAKVDTGIISSSRKSSMSSNWADIDNDGDLDLFVANAGYFQEIANQLFRNESNGYFVNITPGHMNSSRGCNYGSNFADYDNDGDLDLFVGSGFCVAGKLKDFLFENDGAGNFSRDLTSLPNMPEVCTYGAAWGDYDNDGFLDLMIAHCQNRPAEVQQANTLYHNNGNGNSWFKIRLEGVRSNRSAIGAKVKLKAQINGMDVWQLREISSQSGYCGQNSLVAHFGLGDATSIDSIQIEWPSGIVQHLLNMVTDTLLDVIEDLSSPISEEISSLDAQLICHPNPVRSELNIAIILNKNLVGKPAKLSIVDALGKQIHQENINPRSPNMLHRIKTRKWAKGVYSVRLEINGLETSQKVVRK